MVFIVRLLSDSSTILFILLEKTLGWKSNILIYNFVLH